MIVFDLRCGNAHVFEAWFGSSDDYEAQGARGLISCPICGNGAIAKAAMAPAVPTKSNRRAADSDQRAPRGSELMAGGKNVGSDYRALPNTVAGHGAMGKGTNPPSPAAVKAMLSALAAAQAHVEASCDYVGDRFAATARAIHDGDMPSRGIFGEATRAEAADLVADGIAITPLPFRSRRTSDA